MKTYVIRLQGQDGVASAREKIGWGRSSRILLVFPENKRIITSWLELKLLQRAAIEQGAQLALVVLDRIVVEHASNLAIPVFSSVRQAEKQTWRSTKIGPRLMSQPSRRKSRIVHYLKRRAGRTKVGATLMMPLRLGIFVVGIIAVMVMGSLFFPRAVITIGAVPIDQSLAIPVWADLETDQPSISGRFPAYEISVVVQGEGQAPGSGKILLPIAKAKGQIQLVNLSERPVDIPTGTVVMTLSVPPVRFVTLDEGNLIGQNDEVSIQIEAMLPGSIGNVEEGAIKALEGNSGFVLSVINDQPTSGGKDQEVIAPTEMDYNRLREQVMENLDASAVEEINSRLMAGDEFIPQTLVLDNLVDEVREPPEGDPGDAIRVKIQAEFKGLYYKTDDMNLVSRMALDASLPDGFTVISEPVIIIAPEGPEMEGDTVRWQIYTMRKIQQSKILGDLPLLVAGRTLQEAQQIVNERLSTSKTASIDISPKWFPRLPFLPYRIDVRYQ